MRVIRGKYKNRRFNPPKNFHSRPTTDYAKESLFNILDNQYYIEDLKVLDLFAGTGNISLEFLSRGSDYVLSIDHHYASYVFMKKTKNELNESKWHILKNDVFNIINKIEEKFDLIFADPPFKLEKIYEIPDLIFKNNVLVEKGVLIIEHGDETDFSKHTFFKDVRKYGGVNFSFFIEE